MELFGELDTDVYRRAVILSNAFFKFKVASEGTDKNTDFANENVAVVQMFLVADDFFSSHFNNSKTPAGNS